MKSILSYIQQSLKTDVPVVDQIVRGDGQTHEIKVSSCRAKLEWSSYITIRYRGGLYQMFKQETEATIRPFVYYLRKPPAGHLCVVVHDYNPTDVIKN